MAWLDPAREGHMVLLMIPVIGPGADKLHMDRVAI